MKHLAAYMIGKSYSDFFCGQVDLAAKIIWTSKIGAISWTSHLLRLGFAQNIFTSTVSTCSFLADPDALLQDSRVLRLRSVLEVSIL